jgi:hypothetical protein
MTASHGRSDTPNISLGIISYKDRKDLKDCLLPQRRRRFY